MNEQIDWNEVYKLWKYGRYDFRDVLDTPIEVENVFVEYNGNGYIYGYDWLEHNTATDKKSLIAKNPSQFLYLTPSNKGTIHTAEMLSEAQDEEELAAIWIAATAKEIYDYRLNSTLLRWSGRLYRASCGFLNQRFYLWHHAMKKLVPEIMIPQSVLENISCKDAEPVISLIQLNTILVKNLYKILCYSSLKDGDISGDISTRIKV